MIGNVKGDLMMTAKQYDALETIARFEAGELPDGTSLCISTRMWNLLKGHGYVDDSRKITDAGLAYLGRK